MRKHIFSNFASSEGTFIASLAAFHAVRGGSWCCLFVLVWFWLFTLFILFSFFLFVSQFLTPQKLGQSLQKTDSRSPLAILFAGIAAILEVAHRNSKRLKETRTKLQSDHTTLLGMRAMTTNCLFVCLLVCFCLSLLGYRSTLMSRREFCGSGAFDPFRELLRPVRTHHRIGPLAWYVHAPFFSICHSFHWHSHVLAMPENVRTRQCVDEYEDAADGLTAEALFALPVERCEIYLVRLFCFVRLFNRF
jgi:hypothetical protein